ncbi:hypothetical protein, variant [Aphanomyces invadans]|uniref:t-SNARE coiled-coil homology domain-containing protein n=1 Tax=Aphanomyces invadans TaxID=157072 RepID=A0A024U0Z3_9STRA|nr:hypothetical protein, variant [Aphanomyces invadans]ETV99282.1 hypothetical protein, variant [Aphanomyces invadans]|eukprot:XP_008871838.1 hypothetical protein, variant [Aphanomyces invadans]
MEIRRPQGEASAKASRSEPQQKYIESLRTTAETLNIARETAVALSQQSEALDRAERNLDLTETTVKQANHVVRGMTWSGWLYNKFTKEPSLSRPLPSTDISMGFICPECRVAQRSQHGLLEHYASMHGDGPSSSPQDSQQRQSIRELFASSSSQTHDNSTSQRSGNVDDEGLNPDQRAFLDALAPQLLEMKHASRAIGNALDHHNAQLDRIDAKSEKTKDDLRLVTAKAVKLTSSSMTIDAQFRCALQEQQSRRFLTVVNGDPTFSMDTASESCIFRAFTLTGNAEVWGFQHEQSMRWLGLNMFGSVKVISTLIDPCQCAW